MKKKKTWGNKILPIIGGGAIIGFVSLVTLSAFSEQERRAFTEVTIVYGCEEKIPVSKNPKDYTEIKKRLAPIRFTDDANETIAKVELSKDILSTDLLPPMGVLDAVFNVYDINECIEKGRKPMIETFKAYNKDYTAIEEDNTTSEKYKTKKTSEAIVIMMNKINNPRLRAIKAYITKIEKPSI